MKNKIKKKTRLLDKPMAPLDAIGFYFKEYLAKKLDNYEPLKDSTKFVYEEEAF